MPARRPRGLRPTLFEHVPRDETSRSYYEGGNDDRVVEVADHRDEVGDQIDRRERVRNRSPQEPAGEGRSLWVAESKFVDSDLPPKSHQRTIFTPAGPPRSLFRRM